MLDTSIALQTQGPADPLERYGKALALRNAITQGKSQDLQLQQQQTDFDDQQKLKQAYSAAGGDLAKTQENFLKLGGSPKTLINLKDTVLKQAKDMADLDDKKYTALKSKNEIVGGKLNAVLSAPPDQQPAVYQAARAELIQQGLLDPAHAPEEFPGAPALKSMFDQTRTGSQMLEMSDKIRDAALRAREVAATETNAATTGKRETREADQQARQVLGSKLGAAKSVAEYGQILGAAPVSLAQEFAGKTPEQARQMVMTGAEQASSTESNRHNLREETLSGQRTATDAAQLKLAQQRYGFETGGGVSPQAKAIAAGELSPATTRMMLRSNPGLIAQVKTVDPNFDDANIENRYNTLKEFTSTSTGKAGGQVLALNTLIHHADLYAQAATALKNGSFRPGNAAYNAIATAFGSAPPTSANLVARFLAGETGKVATGGVPAEGEVKGILASLGNDASPEQIANAGKTLLQIAAGRATPLMERVKQAKIEKQIQVLGPDAQEILKRSGFDPETMKPAAVPSGLTLQDIEAEIARRKKAK